MNLVILNKGMEILPSVLDGGINRVDHHLSVLSGDTEPDPQPVPDATDTPVPANVLQDKG
jgi:hypothetical protein